MIRGVSRQSLSANIPTVGYGYVFLPMNVDREKYIKSCYRQERVSIFLDQGGSIIFDCYIDRQKLQEIKFPQTNEELGSMVIFLSMQFNNKPIIVAVISKNQESQLLKENYFKIFRDKNGNYVNISGSGNGELFISVKGNNSKIKIDIIGEESELIVKSEGLINVNSLENITINSSKEVVNVKLNKKGEIESKTTLSDKGFIYEDDQGNKFKIDRENKKINNFEGNEPIPLGNKLQTQLNQNNAYLERLKTAMSSTLVILDSLGVPASTTFNTAMTGATKGDYSNIKSEKTFTD